MKYNTVATIVVLSSLAILISIVSIHDYYTNQSIFESDFIVIEPITTTDDGFEFGPNGIDTNRRLLNDKDIANLLQPAKITLVVFLMK